MTIYKSTQMTNEEYQQVPCVSGSILSAIHRDCPAAWKYGEEKSTPALADGIAAHVAVLEHDDFEDRFYRVPEPKEGDLVTAKDMQSWLKEAGIKGASGKTKKELVDMVLLADDEVAIYDLEVDRAAKENEGKQPVKASVFDMIDVMRRTLRGDPEYDRALTGGRAELSCINKNLGLKCRWDYITADGEIWDYKTTTSAHPEAFGRQAHDVGYWLKMALQADLYEEEFGEPPGRVVLLAQSKKPPYIPQAYELTKEQLEIGREQYQAALKLYESCSHFDSWPAYGGGVQELFTMPYIARMYGMEMDNVTVEVDEDE